MRYATEDDTAYDGIDYTGVSGVLSFLGNERVKSFTIPTRKDLALQGTKAFLIHLSTPTGVAVLATSGATVTIQGYVEAPSSSSSSSVPAATSSTSSIRRRR